MASMTSETTANKIARIERYISTDTAAAQAAEAAGDYAAAAVLWAVISNLIARSNGLRSRL